ncbi:predicted protein [Thalassiosira pseudonana CCMP1335]|uniref:Uncharacterized protein n=1 Tax=Thalassiosira pseudonana TaxID=35128 RepID=B5YP14_THAPS|nr:predicted protein [Thalassiosira pseudonana CCMP1335]ACI64374.1 predicted protein [Thalassiosira pseudonana CCMP1335]
MMYDFHRIGRRMYDKDFEVGVHKADAIRQSSAKKRNEYCVIAKSTSLLLLKSTFVVLVLMCHLMSELVDASRIGTSSPRYAKESTGTLHTHANSRVLRQSEGDGCNVHEDCDVGLFCNDKDQCEALTGGSCILSRGDVDCELLDAPLRTKCHVTEGLPGRGACGCDNDPNRNPCAGVDETCDFLCQHGDAIPSCAKSQSRNSFCIDFTGNVNSVRPSGGGNCVAVDPPTSPPSTQQYPPCGSSVPLTSRV